MKGKYVAAVAVVAMSLLTAGEYTAKADQLYLIRGNGTGSMTVEQLLISYENNSAIGRQIRNELYLASLEEQNARTSKDNAEDANAMLKDAIAELEQQKALLEDLEESEEQVQLLEQQMESLETKRKEQEMVVLGADLGWEQKAFYTENYSTLHSIRMNQAKYVFLSKILNLSVLDIQNEYYSCCEELLKIKEKVVTIKEKYGISVETEKNELLLEEKQVEGYMLSNNVSKETLSDEVNDVAFLENASLVLDYETVWKRYNEESTIQRFLNNAEAYLQAGYYRCVYSEYEQKLPVEEAETKVQAGALEECYTLQEELSRIQIEAYAKNMLASYADAERKYEQAEEARVLCEKKYYAESKKYEYGMATALSVLECKRNWIDAVVECQQCITEKVRLEYRLNRGVLLTES